MWEATAREARVRALGGGDATACTGRARLKAVGQGTRGAHLEHVPHGRDLGRIPIGDVRVEIRQVKEEPLHVGDGRDVPVGDGAVCRNGGTRVVFVSLDRRLQVGRARERIGRHVCLGGAPAHNLGRI